MFMSSILPFDGAKKGIVPTGAAGLLHGTNVTQELSGKEWGEIRISPWKHV
jgi:hypothetical protein